MQNNFHDSASNGPDCKPLLFSLGAVFITEGVKAAFTAKEIQNFLDHHTRGVWDETHGNDGSPSEAYENRESLERGHHILSGFDLHGKRVFLQTNGERTQTRVMLAEEY
jgi:hypothetical protein